MTPYEFFRPITFVEGIYLINMHELRDPESVGGEAFWKFQKNDTFWPLTPWGGVTWQVAIDFLKL